MSIARNERRQVSGWLCPCNQNRVIPLARNNCPACGSAMPKADRRSIYRLVLLELRPIYLAPVGKRWEKLAETAGHRRVAFLVLLWLSVALCTVCLLFWVTDSATRLQAFLPPFADMGKRLWSLAVEVVLTFRDMILNLVELIRWLIDQLR